MARRGVATPATVGVHTTQRETLRRLAESVGGPPWVLKVPGHAGGYGVFRVQDRPGLFSLVDYLVGEGTAPLLMPWIDGVHWRVVVVGDVAVAAYRNPRDVDDFRTVGGCAPEDFCLPVPEHLAGPAIAACAALGVAHGGVDVLVPEHGPAVVLECNFPCYFAHAQLHGGVDVAGYMVDALLAARDTPLAQPQRDFGAAHGRLFILHDGTADPAPFVRAAPGPVRCIDARDALSESPQPGDCLLQIGWSTAAFRAAAALSGAGVRTLALDADVEPAILAMLADQPRWPPDAAADAPAGLQGRAGVVGPLSFSAAQQAQAADGVLRAVRWCAGTVAWRLNIVFDATGAAQVYAPRCLCTGGSWPVGPFEPAEPTPEVHDAGLAWARRVGWRWSTVALLAHGSVVHVHDVLVPPDLAGCASARQAPIAEAVWGALVGRTPPICI